MITVLHGSDLHFGKPHRPEALEAFETLIGTVDPDLLVLSGDFTQRAKVREYRQARAFLNRLGDRPTVVTPGNHDVPLYRAHERLFQPHRNYRRFITPDLNSVTRIDGAVVVSLDSTAPHARIVNGRLREWQLRLARDAFQEAAPEDLRVVVFHHHLGSAPDYERDKPMVGAKRTLAALEALEVDLVMAGHLHRAFTLDSRDLFPGVPRDEGVLIVHSGTTSSWRGRARERKHNSCNLLHVTEGLIQVTPLSFDPKEGTFMPMLAKTFPRRETLLRLRPPSGTPDEGTGGAAAIQVAPPSWGREAAGGSG